MSITLSALQRQRRDTAANWTAENPTLLAGEIGLESDTGYWKVGDGATAWTSLAYVSGLGAEIPVDRLADGAARQLLQTDAAGTGVEWTSNVDVPGTLDVTGAATFDGNVTIQGDLTVNGTTTTIDTTTLVVEDKNIEIGKVATPTDVTADGGGITLKGSTDKTINWVDATDAWTLSEHVDIASAKEYRIAGTKVLDATSLGSAVVSSSLTSVGTIGTGVWNGTTVATGYGGTGQTTYTDGELLIGKTDGTLAKATITQGSGVTITNGDGTITIAATGSGGTVTAVTGSSPIASTGGTTPDISIQDATTAQKGAVQLEDSTSSTSTTTAATPNAVKSAYDLANAALPASGGTVTGDVTLNAQSDLRFADSDSSNWVAFQAPATVASNVTWTLPDADGTSGQVLSTDGAGALSWTTADKIEEGNTSAEVIDTGSDGRFVVTTEGTEALRVDSGQRLLVGTSSAIANGSVTPFVQIVGPGSASATGTTASIMSFNSAGSDPVRFVLAKSLDTTQGGHTALTSGADIGVIRFMGSDGSAFQDGATILSEADGTWSSGSCPGRLVFGTTASGSSGTTERLRISSNGTFTGSATNDISDQRLKQNIQTIVDPVEKVKALIGRTFEWKPEAKMQCGVKYGFIAQEVQSVVPELVECQTGIRMIDSDGNVVENPSDADGPCEYAKSVQSSGVLPILVEAFKEALAKIETLEAKVAALEGA